LAEVWLRDNALSVSAVHGKSFRAEGRRFGHVIDPRTGWPVRDSVLAAAVAPSSTDTDALSTGLLVLGRDGLAPLAQRYRGASFLAAWEAEESGATLANTTGEAFRALTTG
jgi:thiamine biosynthesis lipoprotein ApbE